MRADDDPPIVAVFPLPRVVLLPGTTLPLHIFEPRYRAMTRDALTNNLFIALAQLATDKPEGDTPPVHPIAGVGEVVEASPLPDGRFNISLAGRYRARLEELPFEPPYRRARAHRLPVTRSSVSAGDVTALIHIAGRSATRLAQNGARLRMPEPLPSAPGDLADQCAAHLLIDSEEQQRVLEKLDVAGRVRLVTELLAVQDLALS